MQMYLRIFEDAAKVKCPIMSKRAGRRIDKMGLIIELKDAPLGPYFNSDIRNRMMMMVKVCQDYYPETLGNVYILNPPFIFYALFALVKPFLGESTKEKIQLIRGKDCDKLCRDLIEPEHLPEQLGGKLKIDHKKPYNYFEKYIKQCT